MTDKVKYIGLDISTSIIGISLLDAQGNLVNLENINLKKVKCIFEKSDMVYNTFKKYLEDYSFCDEASISIEESLQSFRRGFSSAKTLSQLSRFNGIVSYIAYSVFNIKPVYINVNSARKNLQIKIDKSSELSTKEQIFQWVKERISFEWHTKTLKSGPNKGLVKYDESCYDMSDAYIICKAHIYNEKDNN